MSPDYWAWVDCEMTGLDPFQDNLLEVAMVITDTELKVIEKSASFVISHPVAILDGMDDWNHNQHKRSGLWNEVLSSRYTEAAVEEELLAFLEKYMPPRVSPLCGNTIHQDRFFLKRWMPRLEQYFHYRNIDVSSLKQLLPCWIEGFKPFVKTKETHRALDDIEESIEELRYYRQYIQIP